MISESAQVINCQNALFAIGQMIGDHLQLITGQISINIPGRLFHGQMRSCQRRRRNLRRFAEDFGAQGEECRVAVHSAFEPLPARFTLAQMIRHRQQFRNV
ncbi:MAG: hypothetical protein ACRD9R_23815 [Pyrinomonadaceae bacterium]